MSYKTSSKAVLSLIKENGDDYFEIKKIIEFPGYSARLSLEESNEAKIAMRSMLSSKIIENEHRIIRFFKSKIPDLMLNISENRIYDTPQAKKYREVRRSLSEARIERSGFLWDFLPGQYHCVMGFERSNKVERESIYNIVSKISEIVSSNIYAHGGPEEYGAPAIKSKDLANIYVTVKKKKIDVGIHFDRDVYLDEIHISKIHGAKLRKINDFDAYSRLREAGGKFQFYNIEIEVSFPSCNAPILADILLDIIDAVKSGHYYGYVCVISCALRRICRDSDMTPLACETRNGFDRFFLDTIFFEHNEFISLINANSDA